MLEARNLRKSYATESGRADAVRDISLALEAGQFLAVVGRFCLDFFSERSFVVEHERPHVIASFRNT
jgi:hypothetical protein